MFRSIALAAATAAFALPAFADGHAVDLTATGDAAAGEKAFRGCVACHVVVNEAGETLAGKRGQQGPNLYGVVGRLAGAVEDFRYSDIMGVAGEQGIVWDEANFVGYVQDPTGWLRETTGNNGRGNMTYKVRKEADAVNLYAYFASLAPAPEADATN
ncbi:c-type cytochrome [uncultured Tateyamaria sp.]|uniref:c-type cytochrome n=1 Tax=uncultured Tateyamaria sp. TaxID=455651 RepID=UPI00260CB2D6|nr:c-type cytochrome [uncultured Tateyamaria sp.]